MSFGMVEENRRSDLQIVLQDGQALGNDDGDDGDCGDFGIVSHDGIPFQRN